MLFTRKLITHFIPDFGNITDERFTQVVNALGMEVESIKKYEPINNVVVGQILSCRPVLGTHLNLCEVKINQNQTNQIVCGASGLREGAKVLVALPGAKLPNGITIAKRNIHGMESNGMMCAYSELTNDDSFVADAEKDEIIMMKEGLVGSSKWEDLVGLDDTIYDISVPANRNDENAYLVFCYEIAHKLNLRFNFKWHQLIKALPKKTKLSVDESICSFLAFMDYDVKADYVRRSDWFIKSTLMNHGIKPINQMLDQLAFITLLTNCPTHVYDVEKLQGRLSCKRSRGELKFMALNSKTYTLAANDILICDESQPVSIASVIGSEHTKLTKKTNRARIEIGNFNFAQVRSTSIRLNCETDASKKASRPLSTFLNIATIELIRKYFGSPKVQAIWYTKNWNKKNITLDYRTLKWFINESLNKSFVVSALKKLGYKANRLVPNKFIAPTWRLDVTSQEDMFEDILKVIDMNKLKPIQVSDNLIPIANNKEYEIKEDIKDILTGNYFNEVKTYNLINKAYLNKFNLFGLKNPIKIISNNTNREYFRLGLLDNMLKVYKYNDARKLPLCPIFEIQKIFTNNSKALNLSCLSLDKYVIDSITESKIHTNLNFYKSVINQIGKLLHVDFTYQPATVEQFYNNEAMAIVCKDQIVGYMGKIKISHLKDYDLANKQVYALSMNIDKLVENYKTEKFNVKSFGIFQRLSKDINIILDHSNVQLVNKKIEQIKHIPYVTDVKIINIFNKDNKTIYTVRYYLSDTRQFTANDLESITKQIEKLGTL
ncbi:MAG: phenylalanine--tRNA ligase subunit beta [Mycoplasmoidaceae bacterium]